MNLRNDGHAARSDTQEILNVSALSRSFGSTQVVAHFEATLGPGQRLGLHGPNGSGKSTILRCLSGTLTPTLGAARIVGHDASSFEARTLTGASLAQERSFYRRLTAFENMLFFARLRYRSKKEAMDGVKTVAEELELGAFLSRRVDQCSTGMVQQLSFARALMGAPRLLILDEPTRSLDEAAIGRLWRAIDHRNEVAVVIASHVAADLEHCDRVHELPT